MVDTVLYMSADVLSNSCDYFICVSRTAWIIWMNFQLFQIIQRLLFPSPLQRSLRKQLKVSYHLSTLFFILKDVFNKVINNMMFRTITWRIVSSENKLTVNKRISDFSSQQEECKEQVPECGQCKHMLD